MIVSGYLIVHRHGGPVLNTFGRSEAEATGNGCRELGFLTKMIDMPWRYWESMGYYLLAAVIEVEYRQEKSPLPEHMLPTCVQRRERLHDEN